jgi:tRNA(Arg) A34 adenosine deaminase TadA
MVELYHNAVGQAGMPVLHQETEAFEKACATSRSNHRVYAMVLFLGSERQHSTT